MSLHLVLHFQVLRFLVLNFQRPRRRGESTEDNLARARRDEARAGAEDKWSG